MNDMVQYTGRVDSRCYWPRLIILIGHWQYFLQQAQQMRIIYSDLMAGKLSPKHLLVIIWSTKPTKTKYHFYSQKTTNKKNVMFSLCSCNDQ